MADTEAINKLNELMKGQRIAMLANLNAERRIVSRPMALQQVEFDGDLWFFTYRNSEKVAELQSNDTCNVAFNSNDTWVSLSGRASLVEDMSKAEELWQPSLKAWFPDGLDTDGLALLKVHADTAEYWDVTSNKLTQLFGFAKAVATGKQAEGGENKVVEL